MGINIGCVNDLTDAEFIDTIDSLGFRAVFSGVMADVERQRRCAEILASRGIAYETLHAPFAHINDIWLPTDVGDVMLKELYQTVDRCVEVGAPVAVIHLSSGETPPPMSDIGRGRFLSLVEYAKKKGIVLAFENQRKLANLAWILEEIPSDGVIGFCWDCGHEGCFTIGREFMPLFGDRTVALHLHDNFGIYNGDDHLLPFDGKLDFDRICRQIRESGYTGTMMLEVFAKHSTYTAVSSRDFLARAAEAVKEMIKRTDG